MGAVFSAMKAEYVVAAEQAHPSVMSNDALFSQLSKVESIDTLTFQACIM